MNEPIRFVVYGLAAPAGSKRAFALRKNGVLTGRVAVSDANPKAKSWQAQVASAAREAYRGELLRGPLQLVLEFFVPRPKGHYGSGRNAGVVKASAAPYPIGRPDAKKLARGTTDALKGIVFFDDSQIVADIALKQYGEPARVEIQIRELTGAVEVEIPAEQLSLLCP